MEQEGYLGAESLVLTATPLLTLVAAARDGDESAWEQLVQRLKGVVWRATADAGLALEDREDVFASTFFRLYEHLDRIREPAKLPGWLATTARNEIASVMRARHRTEPRDDIDAGTALVPEADERLMDAELLGALRGAFARLDAASQELLRLLVAVPPLSYDYISSVTGIPRGSLGPTRQRCLDRLRRSPELRPFVEGRVL
jgi:RNA polymerase sigma factor (sigma-70 family)